MAPMTQSTVGMITGIVGALTGIGGLTVSWVTYRRVDRQKTSDLRLELRKLLVETKHALSVLPGFIKTVSASRIAASSARGVVNTGAIAQWNQQLRNDQTVVRELQSQLYAVGEDFTECSSADLEMKLVDVLSVQAKLRQYRREIPVRTGR